MMVLAEDRMKQGREILFEYMMVELFADYGKKIRKENLLVAQHRVQQGKENWFFHGLDGQIEEGRMKAQREK